MLLSKSEKRIGRPKGQGPYGEKTYPIRLPVSMIENVRSFVANKGYKFPLYSCKVQAGSPSSAEGEVECVLDFNEYLIRNPKSTFLVKATGNSMVDIGIFENDILVVDKSIEPTDGKIVVAAIDNQFTVKRFKYLNRKLYLFAENKEHRPIEIKSGTDLHICGVVVGMLRKF